MLLLSFFVESYNHCRWQSAFNGGGDKFQSKERESFHLGLSPDQTNKQTNKQRVKLLLLTLFQPHCALCSFYLSLWKVTITVDGNLLSMAMSTNFNLKNGEAFIWAWTQIKQLIANKQTNKQRVKLLLLNLFQPHCALCSFYLSLWKVTITVVDNLLSIAVATNSILLPKWNLPTNQPQHSTMNFKLETSSTIIALLLFYDVGNIVRCT